MSLAESLRNTARDFGLGRAALNFYHRPIGLIRQSIAEGGPFEQRRTEECRLEMIAAAHQLAPVAEPEQDDGARVSYLSGSRYWHQTLFCFVSLQRFSPTKITPVIFDDGTFSDETIAPILRTAPWAEFVTSDAIEEKIERLLPVAKFPRLRARRLEYPHLRKLTDIHVGANAWTLLLDSDILIFRYPEALMRWFARPLSIYIQDRVTSYGYPDGFMRELVAGAVPARVNVGLYALHGPSIDWERVEYWCARQLDEVGTSYLQEQALTALLLGQAKAEPLLASEYVVLPDLAEGRNPKGVLHHYVAHSKRSYYQFGWRKVAAEFSWLGGGEDRARNDQC